MVPHHFLVVRDSRAQPCRHVSEVAQLDVVQPYHVLCEGQPKSPIGQRSPERPESGMDRNYYRSHLSLETTPGFKEAVTSQSKCREMQQVMAIGREKAHS